MTDWKLVKPDRKTWKTWLTSFPEHSLFQLYEWGEQKARQGWTPQYWVFFSDDGVPIALLQNLIRIYPDRTLLSWISGGPAGDLALLGDDLRLKILRSANAKRGYFRIFSQQMYEPRAALTLRSLGWGRVIQPLNSGLSMRLSLDREEKYLLEHMTKNWRHNLRRAQKQGLQVRVWEEPDVEKIVQIYKSMEEYKGLEKQYSQSSLDAMLSEMKEDVLLLRCENTEGEIIGLRACMLTGNRAWDLLAATTVEGRKVYASYAVFWELLQRCKALGIEEYDLMGIDPLVNPGVYNFKKGTGADPVEYLGEWDWATSDWLRWGANWAMGRRSGTL